MLLRNAVTLVCGALILSTLPAAAVAADEPTVDATIVDAAGDSVQAAPESDRRAVGLIVKTKTSTLSDGLLEDASDALRSTADVVDDAKLTTNVSTIEFDETVSSADAADVAAALEQRSDVEWAVPNRIVTTQAVPPVSKNDPGFPTQRNLWNTVASPVGGYSIKAPSLWRATEGNSGTVVAVIDTGILASHPDLIGKVLPGYDMISDPAVAQDGTGRDSDPTDQGDWNAAGACGAGSRATDSSWHGTFVAGQIAALTGNGQGVAAVAPNVRIQPIRVLGRCGGTDADVIAAIEWASGGSVAGVPANPTPAKILNLSLGGLVATSSQRASFCQMYSYYSARANARGSVVVAAAGNDQSDANRVVPASCAGFISVGATSVNGYKASYSNYGSTVDLSAPGGDTRVDPTDDVAKVDVIWGLGNSGKTAPGNMGYYGEQGTSMAAPQVAGAAALLYSLGFTTPSSLTNALYASVSPFRARSGAYGKRIVAGKQMDLNCMAPGRKWCGRGLLDLSRVEVPLNSASKPVIASSITVGEPLRTSLGGWVRTPSAPRYVWRVAGVVKGTGSVYWPTVADIGKTIVVAVSPSKAGFTQIVNVSNPSAAVPVGPAVVLGLPTSVRYGSAYTVTATVPGATSGQVQLRNDSGAVLGSGPVAGGKASIRVSGKALRPGKYALRAAYVGNGVTPKASSPRKVVTVKKLTAKVSTKLSKKISRKKRAILKVTVSERPNLFTSPTGSFRIYDGKKRIATVKLSSSGRGKKTVKLPKLKKGTHKIRVQYLGNTYISPAKSSYRKVKVK